MALSSFNVQVDLGIGGINTGVSPEKVVKGGLQQLHNGDISVPGRIRKRRGRSVNIDYGSFPTVYDKVSNLFCSDKNTYRIVDGLIGPAYTGNWFSTLPFVNYSRSKVGHKILQRLVHAKNNPVPAQWRDVGSYPTPIVEQVTTWQSGKTIDPTASSPLVMSASSEGRELVIQSCSCRVIAPDGSKECILYGSLIKRESDTGITNDYFYQVVAHDASTNQQIAIFTQQNISNASQRRISCASYGQYACFRMTSSLYVSGNITIGFDATTLAFSGIGELQAAHVPSSTFTNMQLAATKTHFVIQGNGNVHLYTFASIMAGGTLTPALTVTTTAISSGFDMVVQGYTEYGSGGNFGAIWWSNNAPWTLVGRIWNSSGVALTPVTTIATLAAGINPLYTVAKPVDIPHSTSGILNSGGQSFIFLTLDQTPKEGINACVFGLDGSSAFVIPPATSYLSIEGFTIGSQPFSMAGRNSGTNIGSLGDLDNNYVVAINTPMPNQPHAAFIMQFGVRWIVGGGTSAWEVYSRIVAKLADGYFFGLPNVKEVACANLFDDAESVVVPLCQNGISDCRFLRISNNSPNLGIVISDGTLEVGNGGYPCSIGDNFVHEREPLIPPEIVSAISGGAGSTYPAGTYLVALVSRISHPNGVVARSYPNLFSFTLAAGASSIQVTASRIDRASNAPMGLTGRFGSYPNNVEVYITPANSTVLYLHTNKTVTVPPTSTTDWVFPPAATYSLINPINTANPILYTVGGEIENVAAHSCKSVTSYRNRRVAICGNSEPSFWVSKEQTISSIGQFTDVFRQPFSRPAWEITATEELDDKLILFCQDSIWYVSGDGPNDTGTQGGFAPPTRIADGVGCINARSLVRLDNRIIFRAREGFYFLNSNLSIEKVSMPSDWFAALNRFNVVSAIQIDSRKSVYFFTKEGWILTFYPETGQWSADNAGISYGTRYNDNLVVLRATDGTNANIATAMDSIVTDPAQFAYGDYGTTQYPLIIKTGWIDFAGLQNLNRVWRCILLGRAYSNCTLNVGFSFDYHPQIVHTQQIPVTPAGGSPNILTYQDPVLYEQAFPSLDVNLKPAQWRITMPRQKIESVQLTIWDSNQAPTASTGPESGASFELNQITFECGLRQAVMKLGAAQSY